MLDDAVLVDRVCDFAGRNVHVGICTAPSERRVRVLDAIEAELVRRGIVSTRADADTWAQTLARSKNICQRKLPPPARNKVCVLSDLDVYVACDRGCVPDIKRLLETFAESPVSIVFACDAAICAKIAVRKCGVHIERLCDVHPTQDTLAVAKRCLETSLVDLGGLDTVCDLTDAWGGNMFSDTLFHNTPQARSHDASALESYLERAVPYTTICAGASFVSVTDGQVRRTVNGYRAGLACGWWLNGQRGVAPDIEYTNTLSQCNLRATTKKRLTGIAVGARCSLAEVTWEDLR